MLQNLNDDEALMEKGVSSRLLYDGTVVHLYRDEILLPDGKSAYREYIQHVGAVCVLPLTDEGDVLCVRQCRYPFHRVLLELPAGKLNEKTEDPAEAARRELAEETGARCAELLPLGPFYPTPAYSDEVIHLFLARGLSYGVQNPDEDEFLDVVRVPIGELVAEIAAGRIPDSKTQALTMRVWFLLQEEKANAEKS